MPGKSRFIQLSTRLRQLHPEVEEPDRLIDAGLVEVDGRVATNPRSLVLRGSAITLGSPKELRGSVKLRGALDTLALDVEGAVALDLGAAAGGFTSVLIERGARRVYAVDVGHGQLVASVRQDAKVVVFERTNLADLSTDLIPDEVDLVTIDLSYLSLAAAVPQLNSLRFTSGCRLLALVKPMFELGLAQPPTDDNELSAAVNRAVEGVTGAGWRVLSVVPSSLSGSRGAVEFFLYACLEE